FFAELRDMAHEGPDLIDATQATFNGVAGASLAGSALQNVEARLYDYHVDPSVGLFVVRKGAVIGGANLTIIGTDGQDVINVNASNLANVFVTTSFGPAQGGFDVRHGRVIVFALGGNDIVNIIGAPETEVHGGAGHDTLMGGSGLNILLGDAGNDTLMGRGTADVLVGGGGQDVIAATGGLDILIAGSLNAGYNTHNFLSQLRTEWLDTSNSTQAMLHDLAMNGINHPDLPSE